MNKEQFIHTEVVHISAIKILLMYTRTSYNEDALFEYMRRAGTDAALDFYTERASKGGGPIYKFIAVDRIETVADGDYFKITMVFDVTF